MIGICVNGPSVGRSLTDSLALRAVCAASRRIEMICNFLELDSTLLNYPFGRHYCPPILNSCLWMNPRDSSSNPHCSDSWGASARISFLLFLLSKEYTKLSCKSWVQSSVWFQSDSLCGWQSFRANRA